MFNYRLLCLFGRKSLHFSMGPSIKVLEAMTTLLNRIQHPSLRLHKLTGKLSGLSSVSINMSYRITLELIIQDNDIILINIG